MKISALNSLNYSKFNLSSKQEIKKKNKNVSFESKNLPNVSYPILRGQAKKITIPDEYLEKEIFLTTLAISAGVDTPFVTDMGDYEIYGDLADFHKNPIKPLHIKNMLKNIEILDNEGIYHGDIEQGHVFYSKNGSIQIDCFRFGEYGDKAISRYEWELPKNIANTNLYDFENNCLGSYLKQINNENKENQFIKNYLKLSSEFHKKKAAYLEANKGTEEQIRFEKLQAKFYENPDDDIISVTKDRIKYKNLGREAFTKYDEGNGACFHDPSEEKRQEGINLFFDTWVNCTNNIKKINSLIEKTDNKEKAELLNHLLTYDKHWDKNYGHSIIGMAKEMVNPENKKNISYKDIEPEKIENFERLYSKACNAERLSERQLLMDVSKNYFNLMLERNEHI